MEWNTSNMLLLVPFIEKRRVDFHIKAALSPAAAVNIKTREKTQIIAF
jgi:hypothetical protein